MKLDSLDQLVEFLNYKGLRISDLDFSIDKSTATRIEERTERPRTRSCVVSESAVPVTKAKITNLQGNPDVMLKESDKDVIFVKDFESIPNSCHMGKINILDRELYAGICTEGDESKISLSVAYYSGDSLVETTRQFKIVKIQENQEEQILLNIS